METASFILYNVFFYILHIIPLRMTNCSQGINQKKVYFILLGIIHWLTQHDLSSNGKETHVPDHVLMLATTSWVIHSCAFPFFCSVYFFCFSFLFLQWACMMNCSSLLFWGERISSVATDPHPSAGRSSFIPHLLLPHFTANFLLLVVVVFFCLQQKAYLISVPQQNSWPPLIPVYLLHHPPSVS